MFGKLFGGGHRREDDQALAEIRSAFGDLLIEPSDRDLTAVLAAWRWLNPPKERPILTSAFGDMFFQVRDGRVVMLDTLEGVLKPVAGSVAEMRDRLLGSTDAQDELLSSVWTQAARRAGLKLKPGECFDWSIAPVLGGAFAADNIAVQSFAVAVDIAGQLHEQVRHLPPGTKINSVSFKD
jgi:hypothetical protein